MRRALPLLFTALLVLSACSGDSADDVNAQNTPGETAGAETPGTEECVGKGEEMVFAEGDGEGIDGIRVTGVEGCQPELEFEQPLTVEETTTKILAPGEGAEVKEGDSPLVHYVGINARDGNQFDSSWSRGEPATFGLNPGGVIDGFVTGLVGQKLGSRVLVAIPSAEGYAEGNPNAGIEVGDTILFVVDLIEPQLVAEGEPVEPPEGLPTVETSDQGVPTAIVVPDGAEPPTEVTSALLIRGDGAEVTEQSTVRMHFLVTVWRTGEEFGNTWASLREGQEVFPFTFRLPELATETPGLVEALTGKTVNSRVLIVAPADTVVAPGSFAELGLEEGDTVTLVVDILDVS